MKRSKLLPLGATVLASLSLWVSPGRAEAAGWLTDFEAAKKQASEQGLDLFMNFTGSDW